MGRVNRVKTILALAYAIALGGTLLYLFLFDGTFGRLLSRTFFQSEAMIGLWMERGHSWIGATAIATTIGNFADCNWWAVIFFALSQLKQRLENNQFAKRYIPWFFKPPDEKNLQRVRRYGYASIPVLCLMPSGGILASLITAECLSFDPIKTLFLVLLGNSSKNAFFGIAFKYAMNIPAVQRKIKLVTLGLFLIPLAFWLAKKLRNINLLVLRLACKRDVE